LLPSMWGHHLFHFSGVQETFSWEVVPYFLNSIHQEPKMPTSTMSTAKIDTKTPIVFFLKTDTYIT
jgi:hypothetical protein